MAWGMTGILASALCDPAPVSPYDQGNRYFLQQKYSLAVAQYEKALREEPKASWASDAQFFIGHCLLGMGQKTKAIGAFEATSKNYPATRRAGDAHVAVADIYASLGRWRDAMDHLAEASKRPPSQPAGDEGHYGLGVLYMEPRNPERSASKAIEHFRRVIQGWPTSDKVPLAYLGMGQSHLALGQTEEATKIAREVIRKYPGTRWEGAARALFGAALAVQGRPDDALVQQQQAIENLVPASPLNAKTQASVPTRWVVENFGRSRKSLPMPGSARLTVQADSMSSERNRLTLRGNVSIEAPPDTDLGRPFTITAGSGWIDTPGGVLACSGAVKFDSRRSVPGSKALDRITVSAASFTLLIPDKEATARGNAVLQRWLHGKSETARGEAIVLSLKAGTYRVTAPPASQQKAKN